MYGDTITDYYRIYSVDPTTNKFAILSSGEQVRAYKYTSYLDKGTTGTYKFCVSSVSKNNAESPISDTVFVQMQAADTNPSPAK